MYRIITLSFAVILTAVTISACSPSIAGGPDLTSYNAFAAGYFGEGYSPARARAYRSTTDAWQRRTMRNSIVLSAMGSIDLQYRDFERKLTQEGQTIPFIATLASLSLSGAGTLVASSATKTTLAAVDTTLKGAKASYDTDVLAQKTVQFLQKQMRTNRNKVKSTIVTKLAFEIDRYPLELAMIDLQDYAAAGTVTAGLIGIDEQTSQALTESEDAKITEIASYGPNEATVVIRAYLNSGGAEAQDHLQSWLKAPPRKLRVSTWLFLNGKEFGPLRNDFALELRR